MWGGAGQPALCWPNMGWPALPPLLMMMYTIRIWSNLPPFIALQRCTIRTKDNYGVSLSKIIYKN